MNCLRRSRIFLPYDLEQLNVDFFFFTGLQVLLRGGNYEWMIRHKILWKGIVGMTIITIGIAGITAVLLAVQMKGVRGEYATYLSIAAGCFLFFYGITKLQTVLDALRRVQDFIQISPLYLATLLKMTGISYVAEFSSGICRDAGYGAIGKQIEIFGKLSILAVSMPIVLALLETLERFQP